MAKKISLFSGRLIVIIGGKYTVYEKDLPLVLPLEYIPPDPSEAPRQLTWLGNFGFINYKEPNKPVLAAGNIRQYEIRVPAVLRRNGAPTPVNNLYMLDSAGIVQNLQSTVVISSSNRSYRRVFLRSGDPPIAWD